MAHGDSRQIASDPQVCDQRQGSTNDCIQQSTEDAELSEVNCEMELLQKNWPQKKKAIEAGFGSLENACKWVLDQPELRKLFEDELQAEMRLQDSLKKTLHRRLDQIIAKIADVPRWKTLAATDPKGFRAQLSAVLREYKKLLNHLSGIKSHRPKNEAQNSLICEIKDSRPTWSFTKVAQEYTRRTGKPMTAKIAERIYKRAKPDPEFFLNIGATFLPEMKRLQNATKGSRLSRQKSRTT